MRSGRTSRSTHGNDYFVEAVVDPEVVERVDHGESAGDSDRAPLEDDPQTMLRR